MARVGETARNLPFKLGICVVGSLEWPIMEASGIYGSSLVQYECIYVQICPERIFSHHALKPSIARLSSGYRMTYNP
jgi:hypothetical protein